MNIFGSCHLMINSDPYNDHRHIDDFIDADYSGGEVLLLNLNGLHPQTLIFLLAIVLRLKKR
mgnify:CR=1 FL=1